MRILPLALLLVAAPVAADEIPWTDAGLSSGTHVWYRDFADLKARELKAETPMAVSPDRVWEVVSDIAHYREFMPYLAEIRKLEECEGGYYQYERATPPIVNARDYTLRISLETDADTGVRRRKWSLANDKGPPEQAGTVRVTINEGQFEVVPDGKGGTIFRYRLITNPGGSIPLWIAKRASTDSLPDLIDGIRKRALDPTWKR